MEELQNKFDRIKEQGRQVKKEFYQQTSGYIMAALGFVVGLAWNEAIKSLIDTIFPLSKNGLTAKFIYAALITVFVIVVGGHLVKKQKEGN